MTDTFRASLLYIASMIILPAILCAQINAIHDAHLMNGQAAHDLSIERMQGSSELHRTADAGMEIDSTKLEKMLQEMMPDERYIEDYENMPFPNHFSIMGGVAVPAGMLTGPIIYNMGQALIGYGVAAEYRMTIGPAAAWLTSASYTNHPSSGFRDSPGDDVDGRFSTFWALTGLEAASGNPHTLSFRVNFLLGLFIGNYPAINHIDLPFRYNATVSSAATFSYSFGFALLTPHHLSAHLRVSYAPGRQIDVKWHNEDTKESAGYNYDTGKPALMAQLMLGWTF